MSRVADYGKWHCRVHDIVTLILRSAHLCRYKLLLPFETTLTFAQSVVISRIEKSSTYSKSSNIIYMHWLPASATSWLLVPVVSFGISASLPFQDVLQEKTLTVKVPVVLGVMSRCPDAVLCESVIDAVLKHAGHKVDLSLTFLAQWAPNFSLLSVLWSHVPSKLESTLPSPLTA